MSSATPSNGPATPPSRSTARRKACCPFRPPFRSSWRNRAMGDLILDYLAEEGGVAAVELALILPFIAGFAVVSINVWDVGMRKQDMRGALKLGAQYYQNGGADDAASK